MCTRRLLTEYFANVSRTCYNWSITIAAHKNSLLVLALVITVGLKVGGQNPGVPDPWP